MVRSTLGSVEESITDPLVQIVLDNTDTQEAKRRASHPDTNGMLLILKTRHTLTQHLHLTSLALPQPTLSTPSCCK